MLKSLGNTCFLTDFKKSVGDGEDVLISESHLSLLFFIFSNYSCLEITSISCKMLPKYVDGLFNK